MSQPLVSVLWLWAALAVPSFAVVAKFLNGEGVLAYALGAALCLALARRLFLVVPPRAVTTLAAITALLVVLTFVVVYPRVDSRVPGTGSDDDSAHDVGVAALLGGTSPYSHLTYLGNQLHQLPGAFLLAAPFAVVWTSGLQGLFWLPLFFLAARGEVCDRRTPLVLAWLVLGLSPGVMHQVVTGSSYSANTISVLLGLWWIMRSPTSWWAAVAWGVALCSRANFVLLVPLAFAWLGRESGWKVAVTRTAGTAATIAALTLPFYVVSPNFGPAVGWERLNRFGEVAPYSGMATLLGMSVISVALACRPVDRAGLFRNCALVQGFPVAVTLCLSYWYGDGDLGLTSYATFASWFALMGVVAAIEPWLARPAAATAVSASAWH